MPWYDICRRRRQSPASSIYHLRRYTLRSLLTICGPLLFLAFYSYICLTILAHPPSNDIMLSGISYQYNGNWFFYVWFIISAFTLELAKSALASIEAFALMNTHFAPLTAVGLMWHTDANWANPLWWLRAIGSTMPHFPKKHSPVDRTRSGPGMLWTILASATAIIFSAVPLSGITMEQSQVLVRSPDLAPIYGPSENTFVSQYVREEAQIQAIRSLWQSGRQTSPQQGTIFYAPTTVQHVSSTYFDDEASKHPSHIEVFAGPAVREAVIGRAWGLWANISCLPTTSEQLQLIRSEEPSTCSINMCATNTSSSCDFEWVPILQHGQRDPGTEQHPSIKLPGFSKEGGLDEENMLNHSIVVAADGHRSISSIPARWETPSDYRNPYFFNNGHDIATLDHFNGRPVTKPTVGIFEMYFWEGPIIDDSQIQDIIDDPSGVVQVKPQLWREQPFMGFGIHCDIASAVGYADLDPAHRHFTNFEHHLAHYEDPYTYLGGTATEAIVGIAPLQLLTLKAMKAFTDIEPLDSFYDGQYDNAEPGSAENIWNAIHRSLNSKKRFAGDAASPSLCYPLLTPSDVQRSIYKAFGESMIAMMDARSDDVWYGNLSKLTHVNYLTRGPVPWQIVLGLLSTWTLLVVLGSLWMIISQKPRWASSLNGFEMFKFGAQYPDYIDELTDVEFRKCGVALRKIPGTVGLLPGIPASRIGSTSISQDMNGAQGQHRATGKDRPYFIGLSENAVGSELQRKSVNFTFDRREAALTRY